MPSFLLNTVVVKTLLSFIFIFTSVNLYGQQDSSVAGMPSGVSTIDAKVSATSDDNSIEFTPLSSFNNGVLIESVNKFSNKGIPTTFLLRDTASWSFYTNAQERFRISGFGNITSSVPLLINTAGSDTTSMLRVNGNVRIDTSLIIQANSDTGSFISFHRNVINFANGTDDLVSPYTTTPTAWALNNNVAAFRIRHPLNVSVQPFPNESIRRDFMILPYEFGMAIEYNGIVECWVGEWSIHKGLAYNDPEGLGNGWGGVLWVGDDNDYGGVRSTARNNTATGGNIIYGEVSVEKFSGLPNGDLRLRLPSIQNQFHFVYGGRGSNNIIAKMKNDGLVIPKVSAISAAHAPEVAQIVFDSTDKEFKGYDGIQWVNLSNDKAGSYIRSSNGMDIIYSIPHALGTTPVYFNVLATNEAAAGIRYVTADASFLYVNYATPPPAGINSLSWNWSVKR